MDAALEQAVRGRGATIDTMLGVKLPLRFAGVETEWKAAREHCAVLVAGYRSVIAATGTDRIQFLQGMLSNDVKQLAPGAGIYAALLTQQGKIVADLRVYADPDRLLLDVLATRAEPVVTALNRFLVADDVELAVASDEQPLLGLAGPVSRKLLEQVLAAPLPAWHELAHARAQFGGGWVRLVAVGEAGGEGYVVCGQPGLSAPLFEALCAAGAVPLGGQALNVLRIEAGVPWYGIDMDEDVLLMEVGLERAVSFTKGCYLGQEVVERVTARGHVNRKLTGLVVAGARVPAPGAGVLAEGRAVGRVTSAVRSIALDRVVALGYVHRDYLEEGTPLAIQIGDELTAATVAILPFVKDGVAHSSPPRGQK